MPVFNNILAGASGSAGGADAGYKIERSLRFNDADTAHLSRTPSSASSGNKKLTYSVWVKGADASDKTPLYSASSTGGSESIEHRNDGTLVVFFDEWTNGAHYTTDTFRDPSAWYHFVFIIDTTLSTAADRVKIYVNGKRVSTTISGTLSEDHTFSGLNQQNKVQYIGRTANTSGGTHHYASAMFAEIHMIDGQALAETDFGEFDATTGVWNPIAYTGTYGTNGFYLDFSSNSSNSALGTDSSSNTNTWTVNNLSVASGAGNDSLIDSPTNYQASSGNNGGNYATLNPLQSSATLSNGNLDVVTGTSGNGMSVGTIGMSSGKYYWEVTLNAAKQYPVIGIVGAGQATAAGNYVGFNSNSWGYQGDGDTRNNDSTSSYGSTYANGDVIGVAFDADTGSLYFYKNGTAQNSGTAVTASANSGPYFPAASDYNTNSSDSFVFNFGQRPFTHTIPTGYKALCTQNFDDPTIADGSDYFDIQLWTGNATDNRDITGYDFSPDLVWIKERGSTGDNHLFDTVRGATKALRSNEPDAEVTDANELKAFNPDGFRLGTGGDVNASDTTTVGWAWDAGSSNTSISVGGLNSSNYNQDQTWSTYGTFTGNYSGEYDWAGVFSAGNTYDAAGSLYLTSGTGKWTLTSSLACSSEIKIYVNGASSFTINEGLSDEKTVASSSSGFHYVVIPFSGNISSIKLNTATQYTIRIYVDGKALIDQGITLGGAGVPNYPTIATTYRANPAAGFSIVSYEGTGANASIGHGLNAAPEFFFGRNRNDTSGNLDWIVYHQSVGNTGRLKLNGTGTISTSSTFFQDTSPTSSVITIGTSNDINKDEDDYILYCFAPVEGYSAFGNYTGNGAADGPFVYTGFKVAWLMIKQTNAADGWMIYDKKRSTFNQANSRLQADTSDSEYTGAVVGLDFLSNGFKIRTSDDDTNASSGTYIYAAFAENPFKISRAR